MKAELPPPSPELVLWRVTVEAWLEVAGPKDGKRFLRSVADRLILEEGFADVAPIRPSSEDAAVSRARREATAVFRQQLPRFMAKL